MQTLFFLNKLAETKLLLERDINFKQWKKTLYKPMYSASLKKKARLLKHSMLYE